MDPNDEPYPKYDVLEGRHACSLTWSLIAKDGT
jgi:hypothetical protein